jgi:hypothetical protein
MVRLARLVARWLWLALICAACSASASGAVLAPPERPTIELLARAPERAPEVSEASAKPVRAPRRWSRAPALARPPVHAPARARLYLHHRALLR